MAKKLRLMVPHGRQQVDELVQLLASEVAQELAVNAANLLVEPFEDFGALGREPRGHETPIRAVSHPRDEAILLHPIEQPGHVRHPPNQALADRVPAQTDVPRSSQDAQNVVLRRGQVKRLQRLRKGVLDDRRRAGDVERGLLLEAGPRFRLLQFVSQRHERIIDV